MLKFQVEEQSQIPEGMEEHYREQDGMFVLDVSGAVPKSKVDEFRQKNIELMEKEKKYAGIDLDSYHEALSFKQKLEEKKMIEEDDFEGLIEKRLTPMKEGWLEKEKEYQAQLKEKEEAISTVDRMLSQQMLESNVVKTVNDIARPRPNAMKVIIAEAAKKFRRKGDKLFAPDPEDPEKPLYGKDGKELTIATWLPELVQDMSFLFESASGGGAAGGTQNRSNVGFVRVNDAIGGKASIDDIVSGKTVVKIGE